mmetsp:Transcript_12588/g.24646  ORF Transcript_12588/g.24646 Transcript_12588/m.24646 type:complete len:307 (-) Transcript_12588:46-966(-)
MPPKARAKNRQTSQRALPRQVAPQATAEQVAALQRAAAAAAEQAAEEQRRAAEREAIVKIFHAADVSKDGFLYLEDLQVVLEKLGVQDADHVLKEMDVNRDGKVSVDEFVAWVFDDANCDAKAALQYEQCLRKMFGEVWDALRNDVDALTSQADAILEQGKQHFETAVLQLEIEKATFAEMRSLRRVPPNFAAVVEALIFLLEGTTQPQGWPACQQYLGKPHVVYEKIRDWENNVQSESLNASPAGVAAAQAMLREPSVNPDAVRSISNAGSRLCIWIQGMVEFYNVRQQVKMLQWAAATARANCQ